MSLKKGQRRSGAGGELEWLDRIWANREEMGKYFKYGVQWTFDD